MTEIIKKHFPKRNSYKQVVEFDNNLFVFENWKWLSYEKIIFFLSNDITNKIGISKRIIIFLF